MHFSLLPRYRGAAPVIWAIAGGESVTGVTTMQMDEGLDTGDILLQKEVEISGEETAGELMTRLSHLGGELIGETLAHLNEIVPRKQDDSAASLAPMVRKEDGRIDWNMEASSIQCRVRAFQPFPRSFTTFRGEQVTVWRTNVSEPPAKKAPPGTVLGTPAGILRVVCGNGTALDILELQMQGKRRIASRDFVNGYGVEPGSRFGD